ncbi:unnamed protein product [Ilex paraguariensis]|uniref:Uncharacterized protein n=1 Tax=Ilex paraguariensis TaxID=185542 RepID=A0ABC8TXV0_9AQUA
MKENNAFSNKPIFQSHSPLSNLENHGPNNADPAFNVDDSLIEVGVTVDSSPSHTVDCLQKGTHKKTNSHSIILHICPNWFAKKNSTKAPRRRFSQVEQGKSIRPYKLSLRDPDWSIQEVICGEKQSLEGKGDEDPSKKTRGFKNAEDILKNEMGLTEKVLPISLSTETGS